MKINPTYPLHWHVCYSCEDQLLCACEDRRQYDRETGKERRIYCFGCTELNKLLTMAEHNHPTVLERVN